MATTEQNLSSKEKELVALGASVGAGCHPCVAYHLDAGAKAGLDGEQLLAAAMSAERVTAEAAVSTGDHVRATLGPGVQTSALLSRLEEELASLGAALGANDKTNIERHLRAALGLGVSRAQLEQAIEMAGTVQENASRIHVREATRLLGSLANPAARATERNSGCGAETEPDVAAGEAEAPTTEGEPGRGCCCEPAAATASGGSCTKEARR